MRTRAGGAPAPTPPAPWPRPRCRCRLRALVSPPRASLASHELHPLRAADSGGDELSPALAALRSGGVFAVYDAAGSLQYIGLSRQLAGSLAGLAAAFPAEEAASARAKPLPGAGAAALQAAWAESIREHGAAPPCNARGADPRWAKPPRVEPPLAPPAPQQQQHAQHAPPDTDAARWAAPGVEALLAGADAAARLEAAGFVVIDGALDAAA
ncbi:hypothetical protein MNEG_9063, partial [Monoraphidium neglectum]